MHKNVIEGLEAAGCPLQHVYFNAGGKWYGKPLHILLWTSYSSTIYSSTMLTFTSMTLVLAVIEAMLNLLNVLRAQFCLFIGQAVGPMKTPCHESDPRYSNSPSNECNSCAEAACIHLQCTNNTCAVQTAAIATALAQ